VWSRHSFYWCAVSISICRRARTARLPFQRPARAVSFGPTNYEECLHRSEWLSEWVSEWHICISESTQQTSFQRFAFSTRLKTTLGNYGGFEPYVHIFFKTSSYHSYQNLLIYKKNFQLNLPLRALFSDKVHCFSQSERKLKIIFIILFAS